VAALYLDIETSLLLSNPKSKARHTRELQLQGLPFALAISDSAERGHKTWLPKKLAELWAVMLPADLVVNWALISFDIPMMVANLARTQQVPVDTIRQLLFDPVACIEHTTVRMERLHVPAQVNLSRSKRGSDPEAVNWLRSGDPALVAEVVDYCRCDVELIIDLHRLICSGSWLHLPAQPGKRERKQELWVRVMPDSFAIDLSWWQPDNWAGPALASARRQHSLALGRRHERTGAPAAQSTGRQPGFFLFWFATLGHRTTARSGRTTGAAQADPTTHRRLFYGSDAHARDGNAFRHHIRTPAHRHRAVFRHQHGKRLGETLCRVRARRGSGARRRGDCKGHQGHRTGRHCRPHRKRAGDRLPGDDRRGR
jgi:hypothetical protein